MSRRAVSGEHLAIIAHLLLVSLPSNLSISRLIGFACRSFRKLLEGLGRLVVFASVHPAQNLRIVAVASGVLWMEELRKGFIRWRRSRSV